VSGYTLCIEEDRRLLAYFKRLGCVSYSAVSIGLNNILGLNGSAYCLTTMLSPLPALNWGRGVCFIYTVPIAA
jgi:hypothetical protein